MTAQKAYQSMKKSEETIQTISELFKLKNRNEIVEKVTQFIDETHEVKKERDQYLDKLNSIEAKEKSKNIEEINGVQFLYVSESKDASIAKQMTFELRDQLTNGVVVLVSEYEGKTSYFVGLTASMVKNGYKAGDLVKMINEVTGGRGGGKPDFAQGGCPSQEHINDAIKQIKSVF